MDIIATCVSDIGSNLIRGKGGHGAISLLIVTVTQSSSSKQLANNKHQASNPPKQTNYKLLPCLRVANCPKNRNKKQKDWHVAIKPIFYPV